MTLGVKAALRNVCPPEIWGAMAALRDKVIGTPTSMPTIGSANAALSRHITPQEYWSGYHVEIPTDGFSSVDDSLEQFDWRNHQYPGYIELMPVDQANDLVVMDYGCGPGNDVVGFGHFSKPRELHAVDVSRKAIEIARNRATHHGIPVTFHNIKEAPVSIPLESKSLDLIHSSGVLHHTPDPLAILKEFRRLIKDDGYAQIMVYHYDSLWMHLFTAHKMMLVQGLYQGLSKREAYEKTMDGEDCPIALCYASQEFIDLAREAGFGCEFTGASMSILELELLPTRFEAIRDRRLDTESRKFLCDLTFNDRGWPLHNGVVAGVNACFRLNPV